MNAHTTVPNLYEVEIEQALIGAVMHENKLYWRTSEIVADADFYDPMHQKVWASICEAMAQDRPADVRMLAVKLRPYAEDLKDKEKFDLFEYLRGLSLAAPSHPNVVEMAKSIADLARRRRIVTEASCAIDAAYYDRETLPDQIADKAGEALFDAAHRHEAGNGPEPLIDVMRRAVQMAEDARRNPDRAGVTTGLPSVDARLSKLFPARLYILAADSSMGKSALAAQICRSASESTVALFFAKEMDSEEVGMRFLAQDAGVAANRLMEGRASSAEIERAAAAIAEYDRGKFLIDGSSSLTVAQMRGRAQAVRRREGRLDLIVIDNLRQVRAADPRSPQVQQLDQITRDCKAMAKDMGAAVLLIAPLNRELWKRDSPRPLISDIYGSSAIEYNADDIWFLFREEFYLERNEPDHSKAEAHTSWLTKLEASKGLAEVFNAKRRGGPLGSVKLKFDGPLTLFSEIETEQQHFDAQGLLV